MIGYDYSHSGVPRGSLIRVRAAAQQVVNGAVEQIRNGAEGFGIGIGKPVVERETVSCRYTLSGLQILFLLLI